MVAYTRPEVMSHRAMCKKSKQKQSAADKAVVFKSCRVQIQNSPL